MPLPRLPLLFCLLLLLPFTRSTSFEFSLRTKEQPIRIFVLGYSFFEGLRRITNLYVLRHTHKAAQSCSKAQFTITAPQEAHIYWLPHPAATVQDPFQGHIVVTACEKWLDPGHDCKSRNCMAEDFAVMVVNSAPKHYHKDLLPTLEKATKDRLKELSLKLNQLSVSQPSKKQPFWKLGKEARKTLLENLFHETLPMKLSSKSRGEQELKQLRDWPREEKTANFTRFIDASNYLWLLPPPVDESPSLPAAAAPQLPAAATDPEKALGAVFAILLRRNPELGTRLLNVIKELDTIVDKIHLSEDLRELQLLSKVNSPALKHIQLEPEILLQQKQELVLQFSSFMEIPQDIGDLLHIFSFIRERGPSETLAKLLSSLDSKAESKVGSPDPGEPNPGPPSTTQSPVHADWQDVTHVPPPPKQTKKRPASAPPDEHAEKTRRPSADSQSVYVTSTQNTVAPYDYPHSGERFECFLCGCSADSQSVYVTSTQNTVAPYDYPCSGECFYCDCPKRQ